jgi:hypothetical protein
VLSSRGSALDSPYISLPRLHNSTGDNMSKINASLFVDSGTLISVKRDNILREDEMYPYDVHIGDMTIYLTRDKYMEFLAKMINPEIKKD